MAESASSLTTLIAAIDAVITARLAGDVSVRVAQGDTSYTKMSVTDLMALRKGYVERLEQLQSGTEYWDRTDDGLQRTGRDGTVYIGDLED